MSAVIAVPVWEDWVTRYLGAARIIDRVVATIEAVRGPKTVVFYGEKARKLGISADASDLPFGLREFFDQLRTAHAEFDVVEVVFPETPLLSSASLERAIALLEQSAEPGLVAVTGRQQLHAQPPSRVLGCYAFKPGGRKEKQQDLLAMAAAPIGLGAGSRTNAIPRQVEIISISQIEAITLEDEEDFHLAELVLTYGLK